MVWPRTLQILAIVFGLGLVHGQLSVEDGDELVITFHDVEVFRHSADNPLLTLAIANSNITEQHGMFQISEDDTSLVIPLAMWNVITNEDDNVLVELVSTDNSDTRATLELLVPMEELHMVLTWSSLLEFNRMFVKFPATEDERVFGAGEQYTYLNLRGHYFPIWTSEQGIGRDAGIIANSSDLDGDAGGEYYTTYYPQASFISDKKYSWIFEDYHYLILDFTNATQHEVYLHCSPSIVDSRYSASLSGHMIWGPDMMSVVSGVANHVGRQPMLPDWVMTGATLGTEYGTEEMLSDYELAKSYGVNVSAMWIQDWSGKIDTLFGHRVFWNWRWNQTYYPDLDLAIDQLMEDGVRVTGYLNPHLIENSEMFLEADELGYLLKDSEGNSFRQDFGGFLAGTVDLFNVDAKAWYRDEMIANMINLGLGGWMADFGEYTRLDMFSDNDLNMDQETMHNKLPVAWAECVREALELSGNLGEIVPYMRSGALGSSANQVLAWAGDQNVNFAIADGVASTVVAALSLAVSGMGLTHFDIGGFTTQAPVMMRTKELFLRSSEYAAFTPVMRTHLGNKPDSNHQFFTDEDTLIQFARLTQMHAALLPYTRHIVQENSLSGVPVQRPMFLHYDDPGSWDVMYQYLFGPDLIVAPVIHRKQDVVDVHIPGGDSQWIHLWGDQSTIITGPQDIQIDAPMGYPAVFYNADSTYSELFQSIAQEFGPDGTRGIKTLYTKYTQN